MLKIKKENRILKEVLPFVAMEGLGFLDALNSAPVPGIKIKKKKKVLSPTAAKVWAWVAGVAGVEVKSKEGPRALASVAQFVVPCTQWWLVRFLVREHALGVGPVRVGVQEAD